jgi:Glucose-6-phosphate dehydrogenase, NAD binding domain/Glucose-6-phosphate dehydrogenase, C-terminal domain
MAFVAGPPLPQRGSRARSARATAPRRHAPTRARVLATAAKTAPPVVVGFDPSLMDPVHERTERIRGEPVAVVVVGASGDLAKKKCFPALFSLYYHGLLPEHFVVYGFARSAMSHDEFRELILGTLSCRVIDGEKCAAKMQEFLPRCFYHQGDYSDPATFSTLNANLVSSFEKPLSTANRLFYLAVPPSVFYNSANSVDKACRAPRGWTRVVVEKPFGRDSDSYRVLRDQLSGILDESETYRIDHFLGKVLIQNLMTLRFANAVFEPLWNRHHIKSVQIGLFRPNFSPPIPRPPKVYSNAVPLTCTDLTTSFLSFLDGVTQSSRSTLASRVVPVTSTTLALFATFSKITCCKSLLYSQWSHLCLFTPKTYATKRSKFSDP